MTVTKAAERLEIGRPAVSRFLNGRSSLSLKRSPTILRRRLSTTPEVQRANWTLSSENLDAAVVPALVGAWNKGSEADRHAVCRVAGTGYQQVEAAVFRLRNLDDAPVWSISQYRGVCSRIDALFSVAPVATQKNLDDFFAVAESVLSERDPALDLPPEDRWMAAVHQKVRKHSEALRNGIRDTLILLAEYGERLFDHQLGSDNEQRVATLVQRLLAPLTLETLLSQVLTEVQVLPGSRDGEVNLEELKAWLTDARSQCADLDRGAIADCMIGQWLARASAKDGVARPRSEVTEAIEWMASDDVDTGFGKGAYNARGVVTSYGIDGDQDRALAKTYRELADDMVEYPRMRRILEGLARTYADQAKRMDRSGEVGNRLPSVGPVFDA